MQPMLYIFLHSWAIKYCRTVVLKVGEIAPLGALLRGNFN